MSCRLDYCNSPLAGVADVHLRRLQLVPVQNEAACLVCGARPHDHITPILATLHWLPVCQRVIFKPAVLVWKCLHDAAPRYLADLCVPAASTDGRRQSRCAVFGAPWCPGLGRLLASAALLRLAPGPRTDCQRPSDHQNCRSYFSNASSRPTCSSTRQCWLQLWVSCTVVRRRCDCTASSSPTTNVQTRLNFHMAHYRANAVLLLLYTTTGLLLLLGLKLEVGPTQRIATPPE